MAKIRRGKVVAETGKAFVYFVLAETMRRIKIGRTVLMDERLCSLQVGSPDKLTLLGVIPTDNPDLVEGRIQARFSSLRCHGEWFAETDDLRAFIAEHATDYAVYMNRLVYDALAALPPKPPPPPRGRKAILAAYKAARGLS